MTATCLIVLALAAGDGLVAHWSFDEGQSTELRDSAGQNHGKIHGAEWVTLGDGHALQFDGKDDYVDCGNDPSLDLTESMTLEAWIKPLGKPGGEVGVVGKFFESFLITFYADGNCWWYIDSGTNHVKAPVVLKKWNHLVATFDGEIMAFYLNGAQVGRGKSKFPKADHGKNFLIGRAFPDMVKLDQTYGKIRAFKGLIDNVRVYNRAMDLRTAQTHYKQEAGEYDHDTSWFDHIRLKIYPYPHRAAIVAEAYYKGLYPLADDAAIEFTLRPYDQIRRIPNLPESGLIERPLTLEGVGPGIYTVTATLIENGKARATTEHRITYPFEVAPVKSPQEMTVPPLPAAPGPPDYDLTIHDGGGFTVTLDGKGYPFESWFSWPNGDYNWLSASNTPKGEHVWRVSRNGERVSAAGAHYKVDRVIEKHPTHVRVLDIFTNTGKEDVGILIYNHLDAKGIEFNEYRLGGWEELGRKEEESSPSAFGGKPGAGIAVVPVDDLLVIQSVLYTEPEFVGVGTETFALAPGKSYTFEWRVYINTTGDYYDFVNAFRKDEGRIGTVDGGFSFFTAGPFDRRQVPTPEYLQIRNAKYGSIHCLSGAADDPEVSIEGIEFMDFPQEMALLTQQIGEINKRYPDYRSMFHVAHSLYATNDKERFADSKVINADGSQAVWSDDGRYISKERQDDGWQWWIYYPTPGNSFHDALMKSVDVMMDDIGCDGVFMDGFFWGYRGRWTYDQWDGLSADIDTKTKLIKRKKGSVLWLSQPSMIEFSRKVRDKGGVVVANNSVITRSMANERYLIHDKEVHSGPYLHLAPISTALANPQRIASERDIYLDALDKLENGMLFFYYQEGDVTYESLPAQMFPMTFEEIRSGTIKGPDRIVTMRSGVYGWPGDQHLHHVYKYDARGGLAPHDFLTTVDETGARTKIELAEHESAVIVKLPILPPTDRPMNCRVDRYDGRTAGVTYNVGDGQQNVDMSVP